MSGSSRGVNTLDALHKYLKGDKLSSRGPLPGHANRRGFSDIPLGDLDEAAASMTPTPTPSVSTSSTTSPVYSVGQLVGVTYNNEYRVAFIMDLGTDVANIRVLLDDGFVDSEIMYSQLQPVPSAADQSYRLSAQAGALLYMYNSILATTSSTSTMQFVLATNVGGSTVLGWLTTVPEDGSTERDKYDTLKSRYATAQYGMFQNITSTTFGSSLSKFLSQPVYDPEVVDESTLNTKFSPDTYKSDVGTLMDAVQLARFNSLLSIKNGFIGRINTKLSKTKDLFGNLDDLIRSGLKTKLVTIL